jgi:predicted nucleic acid-binding protein
MKQVFADTFYWVALAHPKDHWHERATTLSKSLGQVQIVTTDEVLVEFLTQLGGHDASLRSKAVALTRSVCADPYIAVIPQTHTTFEAGLALYEARPDKTYSLTDCISMQTMKAAGITEVLTHDEHFVQEGFRALFRD